MKFFPRFTSKVLPSLAAITLATSMAPALIVQDTPHAQFGFESFQSFALVGNSNDIIVGGGNGSVAMFTTDSPEPGRYYQKGYYISNVTTSPDGSMFFATQFNDDGLRAKLISVATGETLFNYTSVRKPATFSADGSKMSFIPHNRAASVISTENGSSLLAASYGGDVYVAHQGLSPDGQTLVVVFDGGTHSSLVRYYDLTTQDITQDTDFFGDTSGHDMVGPAFIPGTNDFLFNAQPFDRVERWNTSSTGSTRDYEIPGLYENIPPVVSADGESFFVLTDSLSIKEYNLETGDLENSYLFNDGNAVHTIWDFKISTDGNTLAAIYQDKQDYTRTIELIDLQTGSSIHTYTYDSLFGTVAFSPDCQKAYGVSGSQVYTLNPFDYTKSILVDEPDNPIGGADDIALSADGSRILISGYTGSAIFDATIGTLIQHFPAQNNRIGSLSYFGNFLYKGTSFVGLGKYDVATGELLHTYYDADVFNVALSPDDTVICGDFFREDYIRFYNTATGEEIHSMATDTNSTPFFSNDGKYFMYFDNDQAVVFRTSDWTEVFRRYIGGSWSWWHLSDAKLTPDSQHIVMCEIDRSGDNFGILRVFNIESGEEIVRCNNAGAMEGTGNNSFSVTPDGKYIVCSTNSGRYEVWDLPLEGVVPGPPITSLEIDTPLTEYIGRFRTNNYVLPTSGTRHLLVEIEALEPETQLWGLLRKDASPTISVYDDRSLEPAHSGNLELLCSPTDDGNVYISVYGQDTLPAGGSYTITASYVDRHLSSVTPNEFGNSGTGTLHVRGLNFSDTVTFELREGNTSLTASQMTDAKSGINATTRFNFTGLTPEVRDLVGIWDDAPDYSLVNSVIINNGQGGEFFASIFVPSVIRRSRAATGLIIYGNTGTNDVPAQLLQVSIDSPGAIKHTWERNYRDTRSITLLATGGQSPINSITPDEMHGIAFQFAQSDEALDTGQLHLEVLDDTQAAINWDDFEDTMKPDGVDATEWSNLWSQLKPALGSTWSQHTQILLEKAEILEKRGQDPRNPRKALELLAREIAGEPFAAVTGHLYDSQTGEAIVSAKVKAHATDNTFLKGSITNAEDGSIIIDNLPDGEYELFAEGYIVEAPYAFTITNQNDVLNQTWFATPVEEEEEGEPIEWGSPTHQPVMVAGGDGSLHLVWENENQIHYSSFTDDQWSEPVTVEDTDGSSPALAWGQIDTGSGMAPGLIAVWETGTGIDHHLVWSAAQFTVDGVLWSDPVDLTGTDEAADFAPQVFIDDLGNPQVMWLQHDTTITDDPDVYLTVIDPTASVFTKDEILQPIIVPEYKDTQTCRIWKLKEGKKLPKKIPIIGGKYGFEVNGEICGNRDCQLLINGELSMSVDFSKNFSGNGKIFGEAVWATDKETCTYIFDSATAGLGLGGAATIYSPPIPIVVIGVPIGKARVYGRLSVDLTGQVEWKSNFPGKPSGGSASITGGLTPGGEVELFGGGLGGSFEGTVSVTGKYTPPSDFEVTKYCFSLNGEANALFGCVAKRWEKKWGPCAEDKFIVMGKTLVSDADSRLETDSYYMDDVLIYEEAELFKDFNYEGTANVYEGTPLIGPVNITTDTYTDGVPATTPLLIPQPTKSWQTPDALTVWVKENDDYETAIGSRVVASWRQNGQWSNPEVIDDQVAPSKETAVAALPDGKALAVWSKATTDTMPLTINTHIDAILDTMERADIYYSIHDGSTWSSPAPVSVIGGRDEAPVLTLENDGTVAMAWLNTLDSVVTLFTAHWDGTNWSTPQTVATGAAIDKPALSTTDTDVMLVWAQDEDNDLDTWDDWKLMYISKTDGNWSDPDTVFTKKQTSIKTNTSPSGSMTVTKGLIPLPAPPSQCCGQDAVPYEPYHAKLPDNVLEQIKNKTFGVVGSRDPNEKVGPDDHGDVHYNDDPFVYTIYFENIETATASAQIVNIVDNLSDSFDMNTFTPIDVGFGDISIPITSPNPDGSFAVSTIYTDMMTSEPTPYQVRVSGGLNRATGQLKWTFETIDPQTGEAPEDPYAGFLPPNDNTGRGQGHVSFMIDARQGLEPFTLVTNEATIVFDQEPPLTTNLTRHVVSPYSATEILRHLIDEQTFLEGMDTNDDTFVDDADYIEVINLLNGE